MYYKHVLKDCGKHYGIKSGPCSKCCMNANKSLAYRQGFQAGDTPYVALIGRPVKP